MEQILGLLRDYIEMRVPELKGKVPDEDLVANTTLPDR
jgi:hypothetical protein